MAPARMSKRVEEFSGFRKARKRDATFERSDMRMDRAMALIAAADPLLADFRQHPPIEIAEAIRHGEPGRAVRGDLHCDHAGTIGHRGAYAGGVSPAGNGSGRCGIDSSVHCNMHEGQTV